MNNPLENYEFDVLTVLPNFDNSNVTEIKYLFDKFIQEYNLDPKQLTIAYVYPNFNYLQKYGDHSRLDNLKWLRVLGREQLNFFTDHKHEEDDYINLYNFTSSHRSLILSLGCPCGVLESELCQYKSKGCNPVVEIVADERVTFKWVGTSDREYNYYLDNLS